MKQLLQLYDKYKSVIAYLFFGGLTTLVNLVVFFVTATMWGWNYQIATAMAWFVSVLFAYVTNRVWVFHSHFTTFEALWREIITFFSVRAATLIMDEGIMWIGVSLLSQNEMLTKLVDQVIVVLANYFFSKWFVFRKTKATSSSMNE
ncbi:GtrA family protein [Levilactobacillus parabrevis]|uniref:GtcA family membrane protein n=1 Tax=Levilactobacillus parabrevis ATCC 53295 TaxID=1267003 RepID=A0A0R1GR99_9LACO|nr:GtrA family protein [Levilactobacillus parabrevis]KRK36604.1 GtcA family membrane protein [Levilactobacillus parabrevis ATCC 53295]KRO06037.1 GtcA family membrane protein [Levilactobacillus parabrevis]MCT4488559.1 GtrA family protein [Levilactobacillus parabrevis]MCT4491630.1 GtrA family protein [Levilactobacillus parabrevis]